MVLAYASKGIEVIMVGMARQQGARAQRWIIILLWHTRKWGMKWKWGKAVNLKAHPTVTCPLIRCHALKDQQPSYIAAPSRENIFQFMSFGELFLIQITTEAEYPGQI